MQIIRDCMKHKVVGVKMTTTLAQAAALLVDKHVGMLPVTNEENKLVGIMGLSDMLKLFLPGFVNVLDNVDFIQDFGATEVLDIEPEMRHKTVSEVMQEAVAVEESAGLLRAYTLLLKHELHDLPVVDSDDKLVGIASRVDVGTAFLSGWKTGQLSLPKTD